MIYLKNNYLVDIIVVFEGEHLIFLVDIITSVIDGIYGVKSFGTTVFIRYIFSRIVATNIFDNK